MPRTRAYAVLSRARWAAVLAGVLLGALAVPAGPTRPASAHAVLAAATPAPGSVVATAPGTVLLSFSEPVQVVPGRTQVIAPDGKRVDDGDPAGSGGRLAVRLRPASRPFGTYLVSYRVISADSHPVGASFTFSVGAPSAAVPRPRGDGVDPVVHTAVPVARYLGYAGLVLVVGPVLVGWALWPRRLPYRAPVRLARAGLALVAVSTLAGLWLQAPYTSGAALSDVSMVELRQVLGSRFGLALGARLAVVAAVAALLGPALRRRSRRLAWMLAGLGVVGLVRWPLAGHPVASPQPAVSVGVGVVHLAGMAVWLGGLVVLVGFLLRRADRRVLGVILPVWSRWAALAVYCLVASGVVQALVEAGAPGALAGTGYGRLLLGKLALLAAVLAVAAGSRRLVRRWAADRAAPGRLRRAVFAELSIAAVVLAASAVLVQTLPGRLAGIEAAAAARAQGFVTTLDSALYSVQFEVFPAQLGEYNTFHAYVYAPDGRPLAPAEWTLTTALPRQGVEPIAQPVVTVLGNQGIGPVTFPAPGDWEVRLTIRTSETDQATVSTTIPVG